MNNQWKDDYGKMRWVRINIKRQLTITTAQKHSKTKQLRTKYKRGDRWCYTVMNYKQQRLKWTTWNTTEIQQNRDDDQWTQSYNR